MKLIDGFEIIEIGDDAMLIPVGVVDFEGVVKLNKSAHFIVECLQTETTRESLLKKLEEKYDTSQEMLDIAIDKVINQLRDINALNE